MRPRERWDSGQNDLFKARLDPDRRHGARAGEARPGDRLGLSRGAVRRRLFGQGWTSAAADATDGGAFDPQAYARSLRRGSVRALGREPLLPALLRRGVL